MPDTERRSIVCIGRVFELVDFIPLGYEIWNIGEHMPDGYLPLCRIKAIQRFPGGREIEPDTLKAMKLDGAQTVLQAVALGLGTIEKAEKYLKRHRNAKPGNPDEWIVQRVKAALPIMRQINWH